MKVAKVLLTTLISVFSLLVGVLSPAFLQQSQTIYSGIYPNGLIVTVDGAIVTDAEIQNISGRGLVIQADNVLVEDVQVHNVSSHGIVIEAAHNVTVRNSIVYDTAKGTCYPSCSSGWASAIKVQSLNETTGLAYNILIENNVIRENYGEGIGARGSEITIRENELYDNFSVNIYSNSDYTYIENNYIYCTENSRFYRDALPATGIAISQESFSGWSGHAHHETIVNNIVTGCKNGIAYNRSESGVTPTGLRDSVIAFNTLANLKRAAIRIDSEMGNSNIIVHNNIGTMADTSNFTGISYQGNVMQVNFINSTEEFSFLLENDVSATGAYVILYDFSGDRRTAPFNVGAWE